MDLMQENPIKQKNNSKVKLSFIIVIVLIILLLIAAVVVWMFSQKLQSELFKVTIDGLSSSQASQEEGLFLIQDGKVYTSISNICSYIGYTYYPGGYKQYSEDRTRCYVNNSKETVSFSSGSNEIVKYSSNNGESQTFEIDEEILQRGEKLYISEEGLERAFNLLVSYYSQNNTVTISTLPYLTTYYERNITNASLEKSNFSDSVKFNNEKALLSNLVVIQDQETGLYGLMSIMSSEEPQVTITPRYSQLEFMEGTLDFIVITQDRKVGIIGSDGVTKVKPEYDRIDVIDKNVGLYLVSSNGKQGVINSNGKIIIHQDYDSIGLDQSNLEDPNVTNRYFIYGNCIPVKLNGKWGLIDKNGENIAEIKYDGIGCSRVGNTGIRNTSGVVLIPEIEGIVVKENQIAEDGKSTVEKYGIINAKGEPMINVVLDSAYSATVSNVTTYYVTVQNEAIDIVNWWYEQMAAQTQNNQSGNNANQLNNTSQLNNTVGSENNISENTLENNNEGNTSVETN